MLYARKPRLTAWAWFSAFSEKALVIHMRHGSRTQMYRRRDFKVSLVAGMPFLAAPLLHDLRIVGAERQRLPDGCEVHAQLCICHGAVSEFAGMRARNEQECHKAQIGGLRPRGTRGWWDIARRPVPYLIVRQVFVTVMSPSRNFRYFFAYKFML